MRLSSFIETMLEAVARFSFVIISYFVFYKVYQDLKPKSLENSKRYYVYIFINPIDDVPFYVGKGTNHRHKAHKRDYKRNIQYCKETRQPTSLKDSVFLQLDSLGIEHRTEIIANLSESDAFILEHAFIAWFGRIIYGNGVLTNKISGGRHDAVFSDDQVLIELYSRTDLLEHILRWPRFSKPWPAKSLFFYEGGVNARGFIQRPISNLYSNYSR